MFDDLVRAPSAPSGDNPDGHLPIGPARRSAPSGPAIPPKGAEFDGSWNDLVIGLAIAVVALFRIALPVRTGAWGLVNVGLGVGLSGSQGPDQAWGVPFPSYEDR